MIKIAVVGLGYVGLPLAVAFARHGKVVGFDIDETRVAELARGHDRTGEVEDAALAAVARRLKLSARARAMKGAAVYIVTVPTPVDRAKRPDLGAVLGACRSVGAVLGKGAIVVFESTVYPGVTEEICGPALEAASGLKAGRDFFLGYSPERINPGDKTHRVETIVKVVAGQTPDVAQTLKTVYGRAIPAGIFVARDIKTAEAAKVIENAQRDINIAFINEVAMICQRQGLSAYDVLEAAGTKWNFLKFTPGLVGGHCIGVDPYYLAHRAVELGHHPEIILAGRRINDGMGGWIGDRIGDLLPHPGKILVLGLTFKENVPDLRNSRVVDVIERLRARGHRLSVHDPMADGQEAQDHCGVALIPDLEAEAPYQAIVAAVPHDAYRRLSIDQLARLVEPGGLIADIKGLWRGLDLPAGRRRWSL